MRKTVMIMCALTIVVWAGPAWGQANIDFDGGPSGTAKEFEIPANWAGDVKPVDGDNAYIAGDLICEITTTEHVDRVRLGILGTGGGSGAGTFDIKTGCYLTVDAFLSCGAERSGVGDGTVNQTDGYVQWDDMTIGRFYNGTYNLSGGIMDREYLTSSTMFMLGSDSYGRSEFNQAGGTAYLGTVLVAADTSIDGGDAEMTISGGILDVGGNVTVGAHSTSDAGTTGTFHVVGTWMVPDPVTPGDPDIPGTITIGGNFTLWKNSGSGTITCEADSGGSTTIAVTGTATLASGTELQLTREVGATPPQKGDYDILTADNIDNGVANNNLTLTYESTFWNVVVTPGTQGNAGDNGSITATFLVDPGDTDFNGKVDPVDLAAVGVNWDPAGANAATNDWSLGDFTNDGKIDPTDLAIVGLNWNPAGAGGSVPEPMTLTVMGLGGLALLRRRRSRK